MSQFCNAVWVQMLRTAEQAALDRLPKDATDQQRAEAAEAAREQVRMAVEQAGPRPVTA